MVATILATAVLGWSYADFTRPPARPKVAATAFAAGGYPPRDLPSHISPPRPAPARPPARPPGNVSTPTPRLWRLVADDGWEYRHPDKPYLESYVARIDAAVRNRSYLAAPACVGGRCP